MLNEKQKDFILKSYKTTSIRQIAKYLDVSRNDVQDFVKTLSKEPSSSIFSKYKKIFLPLAVLTLLIVHFAIRYNTFWFSHVPGDQNQYVGLAMKLQNFGINGYTLRGIDMIPIDEDGHIYSIKPSEDEEGSLLRGLKMSGAGYYDIPFFHKGPGFSYALMLSHQIFSRGKDYLLVRSHLGKQVKKTKPKEFFSAQFYAVIVPLFFNTLLMLLTFYLGRMLFSDRIGIYAAFMMTINPVSILTSHKIWADDMVAAFVTLSVVLFLIAKKEGKTWISFLAGLSCGVSVLAKQTGILVSGAILAYSLFINIDKIKDIKKWPFLFFDKHLIAYGLGLTVFCTPWFYKIYSTYGDALYQPSNKDVIQTDISGWFAKLNARPRPIKLFTIGIPYMSPAFVFAYGSVIKLGSSLWTLLKKQTKEGNSVVLCWFWTLAFALFFLKSNNEHRRMLPVYPAIALLSSYFLNKIRLFAENLIPNKTVIDFAVLALLIACAFWSIPIGLSVVFENDALIMKPF